MATRPVFIPRTDGGQLVQIEYIDFTWFPGFSLQQRRRSIAALHSSAQSKLKSEKILEVSSKSDLQLGVSLSAFNLKFRAKDRESPVTVESAYQGSKVFEKGGPFKDLFAVSPREARKDTRIADSGKLIGFQFYKDFWSLTPPTAFYDWLYIQTLRQNDALTLDVDQFYAFTDIEYNPERSVSCQASSVALYLALKRRDLLNGAFESPRSFVAVLEKYGHGSAGAPELFRQPLL